MANILEMAPTIMGAGLMLWAADEFLAKKDKKPTDVVRDIAGLAIGASLLSTLKVDKVI